MFSGSTATFDGYTSSGSEHTIPSPPPTPDGGFGAVVVEKDANEVTKSKKKSPKKRNLGNRGPKLTPWRSNEKLDDVLFGLALIEKPFVKTPGTKVIGLKNISVRIANSFTDQ